MYIHIHIHTYIHIYTYTYTYTHVHIHIYMHIYVYTYIHICIYTCIHVYIYMCIYICICIYIRVCMYICIYVCMYTKNTVFGLLPPMDWGQINGDLKWCTCMLAVDWNIVCTFFCFCCYATTRLALQVCQDRTQVVCSNKVARKRLVETPLFFGCFADTQLARQLHQKRTKVVCSRNFFFFLVAWKGLAQRHFRNSCHMFVCIMVCACSQHALYFKMLSFISFFLSWVPKTQPNHWAEQMASTQLATVDPQTCPWLEDRSIT